MTEIYLHDLNDLRLGGWTENLRRLELMKRFGNAVLRLSLGEVGPNGPSIEVISAYDALGPNTGAFYRGVFTGTIYPHEVIKTINPSPTRLMAPSTATKGGGAPSTAQQALNAAIAAISPQLVTQPALHGIAQLAYPKIELVPPYPVKKCECGAASVQGLHSNWCPMHEVFL